jgi:hypothetical protein
MGICSRRPYHREGIARVLVVESIGSGKELIPMVVDHSVGENWNSDTVTCDEKIYLRNLEF